jgi:hypothetical protein
MDAGIAAVAAGAVGIIGALGGAFVGGRAAVTAAKVAGTGNRELARLQARRQAYADLGSAAFHFTTTADDVVVVFNRRFSGSTPTHVPVPEELYSQLDTRLDDVTHAAVMVQLEGPTEITNLAWDAYAYCHRAERRLSEYGVSLAPGAARARQSVDQALEDARRARGTFLSNARAHLEGQPIPLAGEPYRYSGPDGVSG